MIEVLNITVHGEPVPQGSKRAVVRGGRAFVINDNPRLYEWRHIIADLASEHAPEQLITGACRLTCIFTRPRPKTHYRTGAKSNELRPSAPAYPTTRPDTLKLCRAVEDALTGIIWKDDSQVVIHLIQKRWGDSYTLKIRVHAMEVTDGN